MKISVNAKKKVSNLHNFWNNIHFHPTDAIEDIWGQQVLDNVSKDKVAKHVRMHAMLEDIVSRNEDGKLEYDFTNCDTRCDYFIKKGFKALICFGFMPVCLASNKIATAGNIRNNILRYKGKTISWSTPADYDEWKAVCAEYTRHLIDRYGEEEISTWYFHCWNEPDSAFWFNGMPLADLEETNATDKIEEYNKLYDYFAAGVTSVSDKIKIGGPSVEGSDRFVKLFLEHVTAGKNYVTGLQGTRMDFISVHCYSNEIYSKLPNKTYVSPENILQRLKTFQTFLEEYGIGSKEILMDEWGISGGGFKGIDKDPRRIFRETEYYSSFYARLIDLIRHEKSLNLSIMMICLSGQDHTVLDFDGYRTFFTASGYKKPIYNGYAICAKLGNYLLDTDYEMDEYSGIIPTMDEEGNIKILLYRHCDVFDAKIDNVNVKLCVEGLSDGEYRVKHYRIDKNTSNSFAKWCELGRPERPTMLQKDVIKKAGDLALYYPEEIADLKGTYEQDVVMQQNSISLIEIEKIV